MGPVMEGGEKGKKRTRRKERGRGIDSMEELVMKRKGVV